MFSTDKTGFNCMVYIIPVLIADILKNETFASLTF
jgi:hypothetical protein